jgi:hypothetical protein
MESNGQKESNSTELYCFINDGVLCGDHCKAWDPYSEDCLLLQLAKAAVQKLGVVLKTTFPKSSPPPEVKL